MLRDNLSCQFGGQLRGRIACLTQLFFVVTLREFWAFAPPLAQGAAVVAGRGDHIELISAQRVRKLRVIRGGALDF